MKRILSIDGGGIRGLIPALVLAEIESRTGKPTWELFDLLAGTSTGGLLVLGLTRPDGNGRPRYTARDIANVYIDRGRDIFQRSFWKGVSSIGGLADEKYDNAPFLKVLAEYLGPYRLKEALKPVFVSSYKLGSRSPFFFKSWRSETYNIMAMYAAYATSAAPTYFEPAELPTDDSLDGYIDGGVFLNNPGMSAYAEARRLWPDEHEFVIVSLGTGEMTRPIMYEDAKDWGILEWMRPLFSIMFDGMSDAVDYQLRQILNDTYYRFQTKLEVANDDMDDASRRNIEALKDEALNMIASRRREIDKVCRILDV